ncbi:hypothetical protein M885DRAFT_296770 [Pelagophyceae sp. CCMP2097]|nr:hypothetical protein M885DRAFT_296770 [Pelagophyceae sp. CCMP2097]
MRDGGASGRRRPRPGADGGPGPAEGRSRAWMMRAAPQVGQLGRCFAAAPLLCRFDLRHRIFLRGSGPRVRRARACETPTPETFQRSRENLWPCGFVWRLKARHFFDNSVFEIQRFEEEGSLRDACRGRAGRGRAESDKEPRRSNGFQGQRTPRSE